MAHKRIVRHIKRGEVHHDFARHDFFRIDMVFHLDQCRRRLDGAAPVPECCKDRIFERAGTPVPNLPSRAHAECNQRAAAPVRRAITWCVLGRSFRFARLPRAAHASRAFETSNCHQRRLK